MWVEPARVIMYKEWVRDEKGLSEGWKWVAREVPEPCEAAKSAEEGDEAVNSLPASALRPRGSTAR